MNIFNSLYLKFSKDRFSRPFHPYSRTKKPKYLVSAPNNVVDFLKAFSFLNGLRNVNGTMILLMPKTLQTIYRFIKRNTFQTIFYEKTPALFSKEHTTLKEQLSKKHFNVLIELNVPANIALPYFVPAEKRICLCEKNNFPYYNILVRDGFNTLGEFFQIKKSNPQDMFQFRASSLKNLSKKFGKKRPLLFVNTEIDIKWDGHKLQIGKDVSQTDARAYEMLYLADAYYGEHDAFYEFAKIFNKKIVAPKNNKQPRQ